MPEPLPKRSAVRERRAANRENWFVGFTRMEDGTREEYHRLEAISARYKEQVCDRVLAYLEVLHEGERAEPVDRYEHSLQAATRAFRDGADDETVAAALLHDIGDALASYNHAELGAAILRPFVGPDTHWMTLNHGVFQGYYYFHHFDRDRHERDTFRGHPAFQKTVDFCAKYDQCAFDPDYDTMPLSALEPIVRRVFAREPFGPHTRA
jgi:predicted HD phosphohydrolase